MPSTAPKGVRWELFQGVALPVSDADGPTRIDGPVYAGYSHTPTGALLAAANIGSRYLVTPGNGWREVVREQVLPGTGRDVFTENRAKVTDDSAQPGQFGQLAAFKFVTYTQDVAVIQLVTRFATGQMQVATDTVRWSNGDWRLELQPDGGTSPSAQSVSSIVGYVPWGGV
ncbi:hypothetical protein [Motilibacter deserti]|uniref:DUF8175 domain-containing protein n=1 Tax=Motilibacter deserti TaxID=2714956 RepID=A0ABX0H0C6_9ACTN|nr:hypothetical protein [Motilibacter deserti]NHC15816.1 hypothetical protein [Motilibacter deserti]